jgi:Ca-activated chloride channel family protein
MFDNSLSMQWEKLERTYLALDRLLRSLRANDRLNVVLFNTSASTVFPRPEPASPGNVQRALDAVRNSRLAGGTNLEAALAMALAQPLNGAGYFVLLSDGGATRGAEIANARLASWLAGRRKGSRARLYIFAVGDDANMPLLNEIGDTVEWVRSTEPSEFKLNSFLSKIGRNPAANFNLTANPESNTRMIYPLESSVFGGSMQWWVGQYVQPAEQRFSVGGRLAVAKLPLTDTAHPHLPRSWARARVDALLAKIDREGEDRATIDEIIRLSRKYKFVTPYTSFLAAPRALLRPRLIRPGDPVLRVRTDPSISSVVALFPFGLVKPLRFLKEEDVWQTRFLAPPDMPDGTHTVRLVLRDKAGRVFRESKTFVIASKPPVVRARMPKTRYRRGEPVKLRVDASQSARTITARMYGVSPVSLRWNADERVSTGEFILPAHLPAGRYPLQIIAEDFAHNIGTEEVSIEILP